MVVKETLTRYHWVILGVAFSTQLGNALSAQAIAPLEIQILTPSRVST